MNSVLAHCWLILNQYTALTHRPQFKSTFLPPLGCNNHTLRLSAHAISVTVSAVYKDARVTCSLLQKNISNWDLLFCFPSDFAEVAIQDWQLRIILLCIRIGLGESLSSPTVWNKLFTLAPPTFKPTLFWQLALSAWKGKFRAVWTLSFWLTGITYTYTWSETLAMFDMSINHCNSDWKWAKRIIGLFSFCINSNFWIPLGGKDNQWNDSRVSDKLRRSTHACGLGEEKSAKYIQHETSVIQFEWL